MFGVKVFNLFPLFNSTLSPSSSDMGGTSSNPSSHGKYSSAASAKLSKLYVFPNFSVLLDQVDNQN